MPVALRPAAPGKPPATARIQRAPPDQARPEDDLVCAKAICFFRDGAYYPPAARKEDRLARLLRIGKLVAPPDSDLDSDDTGSPDDVLNTFIERLSRLAADRIAKWAPYMAVVAVLIVILLIIGEQHSLFEVLVPRGLDQARRGEWRSEAYQNWWASYGHPLGLLVYFMACFFGAYILIMENTVALVVVYTVLALPALVNVDIDWLNRDGNYGWMPVKQIFRTIYALLTLHGCTISVLLIALGIQNFPWIVVLVVIWVIVVPLYAILPAIVFGKMVTEARGRRAKELETLPVYVAGIRAGDIQGYRALMAEMERVRTAKIRPTYPGWPQVPPLVISAFLPVVLTIAQIWFSVHFGKG